jgi:hypothetical protein
MRAMSTAIVSREARAVWPEVSWLPADWIGDTVAEDVLLLAAGADPAGDADPDGAELAAERGWAR